MALIVKIGANLSNFDRQMKKLTKDVNTVGNKFKSVGQTLTTGITVPLVTMGAASVKAAIDFESAFAGVEKTFSGTEEQLADLRDGIRNMAKEIPASTTEIAAVAEAAGQLGIKAENIEGFTRTMIDLGEATNMTADVAATEFARFANIVGMSQNNFDRLGSSVVALGNSMATTESEISSMAMRLAAQGSQVGMTEAQIMALAATMSSLGIEAEAGGTAMTTVLKKIQKAVGEGGKSLAGFAEVAGVSSSEFAEVWQNEPIEALDMFIKGLAASGEEGENLSAILSDLGIKGIRESDTILRMAGASDLLSEAVQTSTKAWEENTALSDEAAQRYATTESKLKILWNRIKDVGITIGEALLPALSSMIDALDPLLSALEQAAYWFKDLSPSTQNLIIGLTALAAAIGPLLTAVGIGIILFGQLSATLSILGISMATAFWWVLAIIAALAGIVAVVVYWEEIKTFFINLWESLREIFFNALEAIKGFFVEWGPTILMIITGPIGLIVSLIVNNWDTIKTVTSAVWNFIIQYLKAIWDAIKVLAAPVFNAIKSVISNIWNTIKSVTSTVWNAIKGAVTRIWNSIKSTASTVWNALKSTIMTPVNYIKDRVSSAFESLKSTAIGVWEGIKSGIRTAINGIIRIVNNFINGFNTPAKLLNKLPGVNAPIIPNIPLLATGGKLLGSGMAIVGEAGPELIEKSGSSVRVTPLTTQERAQGVSGAARPIEVHNHFGNVIADKQGLKKLERMLASVRIDEQGRKGVATT